MEEENRKGPGIFYAVVGVATLVVAIIGATFAYFSASASTNEGAITGQTANVTGNALTVTATKFDFAPSGVSNPNLVPAVIDKTSMTSVQNALTSKCVSDGYTGCHVWEITATSAEAVTMADIILTLGVTVPEGGVKSNWSYVLFTATEGTNTLTGAAAATNLYTESSGTWTAASNNGVLTNDLEVHLNGQAGGAGLAANTPKTIYLMVYLANVEGSQNNNVNDQVHTAETGTYSGTVTLDAGGSGRIIATFS